MCLLELQKTLQPQMKGKQNTPPDPNCKQHKNTNQIIPFYADQQLRCLAFKPMDLCPIA